MSEITHVKDDDSIPFYPEHVTTEFKVTVGITILVVIIGILGLLSPVGVGDPADAMNTPAHVKPEWYFLALYQMLKFVPKTFGVMVPVVGVVILALWPFLDTKQETTKKPTRMRFIVMAIAVVVVIAMTIWGEVS